MDGYYIKTSIKSQESSRIEDWICQGSRTFICCSFWVDGCWGFSYFVKNFHLKYDFYFIYDNFLSLNVKILGRFYIDLHSIVYTDFMQTFHWAGQQIFFQISAWFQCRNITQICNKTSCCIVAWSRQTFWVQLNFLLPKNESVLNILVYFLEQFQRFSRGLQPLENL